MTRLPLPLVQVGTATFEGYKDDNSFLIAVSCPTRWFYVSSFFFSPMTHIRYPCIKRNAKKSGDVHSKQRSVCRRNIPSAIELTGVAPVALVIWQREAATGTQPEF